MQVFRVPMEERRYKKPNENAFGDDRQREICRDIMAKTGAAIEISSGKDQGLTIMVTGKPELLAKARRMVLTQLQTQVNLLNCNLYLFALIILITTTATIYSELFSVRKIMKKNYAVY